MQQAVRVRRKKHEITGNSLIVAHTKKGRKKEIKIFSWCFPLRWLLAILSFLRFSPVRCPLQRRNHEPYRWISAMLMSAIKRYYRELSKEYFSLPKVGELPGMGDIKQRARRIFFVAAESTIIYTYLIQKLCFLLFNTLASSTSL